MVGVIGPSSVVRRLPRGHISKTKHDRPIVQNTASLILLLLSDPAPDALCGDIGVPDTKYVQILIRFGVRSQLL